MNPYLLLTLVGLWLGSAWAAYEHGKTTTNDRCIAEAARDVEVAAIATEATAKLIGGLRPQFTTLKQEVHREVVEKPVYRECLHSAEQLQRLNAALAGKPGPAGPGLVPRPDRASGLVLRGDDGQAAGGGGAVLRVPGSGAGEEVK